MPADPTFMLSWSGSRLSWTASMAEAELGQKVVEITFANVMHAKISRRYFALDPCFPLGHLPRPTQARVNARTRVLGDVTGGGSAPPGYRRGPDLRVLTLVFGVGGGPGEGTTQAPRLSDPQPRGRGGADYTAPLEEPRRTRHCSLECDARFRP